MVARETSILEGLHRLDVGTDVATPDAIARLAAFAELLEGRALPQGMLGPAEADRLLERHLLDSAALLPLVHGSIVDVGTGAGLPGVVLACLRAEPVTLLESDAKRVHFLQAVARRLDLRLHVVRARAEDAGRDPNLREAFDTGVARALASPPVALELVLPLVRVGGVALFAVGPSALEALEATQVASTELGGGMLTRKTLAVPMASEGRWALTVPKTGATPDRYPRRPGVPSRRPLGHG